MKKKLLVLCVDRDDDLGKKTRIKSPVVGEKENLEAARALGLEDPTESDVNAIYQAIKTYRELKEEGEEVEVATITGHRTRGSKADREIVKEIEALLEEGEYNSIALVSDGADDEQILPLLESRCKIEFVKTVIIKQTKELEKSYYVIKEVLRDPYFARIIFGLPGVLVFIYGVTLLLGMEESALKVLMVLGGAYLLIKGFGIEETLSKGITAFKKTTSIERASFPLYFFSFITFLLSVWAGFYDLGVLLKNMPEDVVLEGAGAALVNVAGFLSGFMFLFTVSVVLFLFGRMGDMYYRKEVHSIKKYARVMVVAVALLLFINPVASFMLSWYEVVEGPTDFTALIVWFGSAFLFMLVGFVIIKYVYIKRYVQPRMEKGMEVRNLEEKKLGEVSYLDYKKNVFYYTRGEEKKKAKFGQVKRVKDQVVIPQ